MEPRRGRKPSKHVHRRRDDGSAFFVDPGNDAAVVPDELAESLAEEFLSSATNAEEMTESHRAVFFTEEIGGPFLEMRVRAPQALDEDPAET
jgi:hypothetical protein